MFIHQEDPQLYYWKVSGSHGVLLLNFELSLLSILLLNHLQLPLHHHHHPLGCLIAQINTQRSLCIVKLQLCFVLDPSFSKSVHIFCSSQSIVIILISRLSYCALIYPPIMIVIYSSFVFTFHHCIF